MREATGPTIKPLPVTAHLLQPVIERAANDPGWVVAAYRDGDHYVDVTAGEFHAVSGGSPKASSAVACRWAIASP